MENTGIKTKNNNSNGIECPKMGTNDNRCPECGSQMVFEMGCATCYNCGYSYCS